MAGWSDRPRNHELSVADHSLSIIQAMKMIYARPIGMIHCVA
jgi:hypothetical protein